MRCTGSSQEISKQGFMGSRWSRPGRQGRVESFPTETRLKLNGLHCRQHRVEVTSDVCSLWGDKAFQPTGEGGKREVGTSAGLLPIVYFGTRVTQYSGAAAILTG